MKLISYIHNRREHLGFTTGGLVFSLRAVDGKLPATMDAFLRDWDYYLPLARKAERHIQNFPALQSTGFWPDQVQLLAPVPRPLSLRDGFSFRQHAIALWKSGGLPAIAEFNQHPIFYFINHQSVFGPGKISCMPDHFENLDFELQAAIVICKKGRNIPAHRADDYIGGLMIMNDFSARKLQREEMVFNLGTVKGKDFATGLGPFLATTDELMPFEVPCKTNHVGRCWSLPMSCTWNGMQVSKGNLADMEWTFAQIIARASYGVDLCPGDVISSGAVGTGCFMEINGTGKTVPGFKEQWLNAGDKINLRIEGLGELENTITESDERISLHPLPA